MAKKKDFFLMVSCGEFEHCPVFLTPPLCGENQAKNYYAFGRQLGVHVWLWKVLQTEFPKLCFYFQKYSESQKIVMSGFQIWIRDKAKKKVIFCLYWWVAREKDLEKKIPKKKKKQKLSRDQSSILDGVSKMPLMAVIIFGPFKDALPFKGFKVKKKGIFFLKKKY